MRWMIALKWNFKHKGGNSEPGEMTQQRGGLKRLGLNCRVVLSAVAYIVNYDGHVSEQDLYQSVAESHIDS